MDSSTRRTVSGEQVFIVTGANSGLGFATAQNLAGTSHDNTVILASRDPQKGSDAANAITVATGNTGVRAVQLDLSSLASVRGFVAKYAAELNRPIDALVCNAGISSGPSQTVDGLDSVFETNHLGHFLLTLSLLSRMQPTGRVISVTSDMHQPPGPKLRWPGAEKIAHPTQGAGMRLRYSYSKLCNLYFVYGLSRRLRANGSGISIAAFNPGLMTETNFATTPRPVAVILKRLFTSRVGNLETSARELAQLASAQQDVAIDGQYFDRTATTPTESSALSYDTPNADELWHLSESLTATFLT
jgi:NAD(P)-dependent dehydrogenase (short-subunit alcohol dehydrogenase family)